MEARFRHDFSRVRVHTGAKAAESARAVNARAYTVGRDIAFDTGLLSPSTREGRRLLGHELAHVIQQNHNDSSHDTLEIGKPNDVLEQEADSVARRVLEEQSFGQAVHGLPRDLLTSSLTARLQRTIGDGHDLTSPRFAGDRLLEACYDDETLLKIGASGPAVAKVQQALVDAGFPLPKFGVDGKFGSETKAAVKAFQEASGLTGDDVNGIVGPITMGLLDKRFPGPSPVPDAEPRPVPASVNVSTLQPGSVSPAGDPQYPDVTVTSGADKTVTPSSTSATILGTKVEIKAEVEAQVNIFSFGDRAAPNIIDPCRLGTIETHVQAKIKLDGIGIGNRVHLFYHEPTWTLILPTSGCQNLPEIKAEVDFLNVELVPKILELSLKPALTFGEGQLQPGGSSEVELKPWGSRQGVLSQIKITGGLEVNSKKNDDNSGRTLKTQGKIGVGVEF